MTYKRAIAIGLLTSLGISLLVFGIKTGTFKKENIGKTTTPISYNLNKKRNKTPLRVDADDILPISTKWLLNKTLQHNGNLFTQNANITFYSHNSNPSPYPSKYTTGTSLTWDYNSSTSYNLSVSYTNLYQKRLSGYTSRMFIDNASRILEFESEPTGNIYTFLTEKGQPAYNNDILIYSSNPSRTNNQWNYNYQNNGIQQIRKSNIIITDEQMQDGAFINESAPITIYLDAGITNLYINGTDYINNLDQVLNITNDNIVITSFGTTTGQFYKTFTINYFNTRPAITPQPYPDATGKVTEVLDITGLMFQILTMPFTFISQAFNLTLWEGTPYQFNFSNFILSLISIATIIFIIKLFTSGFSVVGNYTSHRADTKLKKSQTKLNEAKTKKIESKTPKKE